MSEIWRISRCMLLVTAVIEKIKVWSYLAWNACSCFGLGASYSLPWKLLGREGAGGLTGLDCKCTFSSVLFSLELFCLELEDQLTSNLLTEQFSPLLKASCMPMHVLLLPPPRHLYVLNTGVAHRNQGHCSRALSVYRTETLKKTWSK